MKTESPSTIINVGVLFGGMSPEHEVSIISSIQAIAVMDRSKYRPVPLYIAKDGSWYTGSTLLDLDAFKDLNSLVRNATEVVPARGAFGKLNLIPVKTSFLEKFQKGVVNEVDVVFVGLHGGAGENGSIQGLCESFNIPYTGSGVFGSALGMDKVSSKQVCRAEGIPVVDYVDLRETDWAGSEVKWLARCIEDLGLPVIVKPARLGSSIGISRATTSDELDTAIEEAFRYDDKVVIEMAVPNLVELNCSVLGTPDKAQASVLEQPTSSEDVLTFKDKYMRNGSSKGKGKGTASESSGMASLDRIIPAPVSAELTETAQSIALRIFKLFECSGVARVDLMLDESSGEVYFNEINTVPGSFSFYLWEPSGVPFRDLVDRMIQIAFENHFNANRRVRSYDINLLSSTDLKGLKSGK